MLEIKTITENYPSLFDRAVNEALEDGWVLVRRECFITGADRATTFYAELERMIEVEEEEDTNDEYAHWELARNPHIPYRCSACGFNSKAPFPTCPHCHRLMEVEE